MSNPRIVDQIFARDPRTLVRFPDLSVDGAMSELRTLQEKMKDGAKPPSPAPTAAPAPAVSAAPAAPAVPEGLGQSLATLATHVWRAKGKLVDPITGEPNDETRRAYRHVQAAFETFAQMGLTMNDWIDQPFDPGLPVKVLTFQPMPNIMRDTVVEAVRPTVIWRDQLLQLGEVVVGIPANTENPK
jgi:hypothetical protein